MDRREAAGLVAVMLLIGSSAKAQGPARIPRPSADPSSQGPVGLGPIRSLDILNGIPSMPGTIPASAAAPGPSGRPPTDPTSSGPPAVVPEAPGGPSPVGLTPLPSIGNAINTNDPAAVLPRSGISSLFRRNRARAAAPPARTTPAQPAPPFAQPLPRLDPAAVPSAYPPPDEAGPATGPMGPVGRPSPYADQVPATARRQADGPVASDSDPGLPAGRPAPLSTGRPASPRPRAARDDRARGPRPTAAASVAPRPLGPRPAMADPATARPSPVPVPATAPVPDPDAPVVVPPPAPPIEPAAPAQVPEPAALEVPSGLPEFSPVAPPSPAEAMSPPMPTPSAIADPDVKPTGVDVPTRPANAESTAVLLKPEVARDLPVASRRAASVGDEVITLHDMESLVTDRLREISGGQEIPADQKAQLVNQVAADVLNQLIDQSMVIQEAQRALKKNAKALDQFNEFVDKRWHDEELPPLLRSTATANEYELKKKLAEAGKSYAEMKDHFRRSMLANDYLMNKIKPRVNADLIEQKAYYNGHLKNYEQPARMTWREIEINYGADRGGTPKYADRASALRQAQATLARLEKGEDFAAVAQAVSDGPTASKGGVYVDMTPGGYGIPSVNEELNRLAVGKLSGIIEAPAAFHIIRVDSRREAGPLRFDEVQEKIREEVFRNNYLKARTEYLAKLRSRTLIRTMFDNTESDPSRARIAADPAVRSASR